MDNQKPDVSYHLQEEHRRLNEAQAIGLIGSFEWNLGEEAVTWSDEMYRINGMEPQSEVITVERTNTLIHPDDLAKVAELKRVSFFSPGHYSLQHRIVLANGAVKWIVHRFESLADEAGTVTRVHGTLQDITDLKKTEEELLRTKDELAQKTADKYFTLFNSIDEGFLLGKAIRGNDGMIDFLYEDVNPAYERITGIAKEALIGGTARNILPGLNQIWYDTVEKVGINRQSIYLEEFAARLGKWLNTHFSPFGAPEEGRIAVVFSDVTGRKKEEERQKFLLLLSDALRPLGNPNAIHETVTRTAMDYFGADRCYYYEIGGDNAIVRRDAYRGHLQSIAGVYPLKNYPLFKSIMETGHPYIVHDVHSSNIIDDELRQLCIQLNLISFVNVPVIKGGKPVGMFCLVQTAPRQWIDMEVELVLETAERTWAAVEKARADEGLRKSEEKYKSLFNSLDEGFCVIELILNDKDQCVDWRYLDANAVFEKQTGFKNPLGKTISQLLPAIDPVWGERYGNVALTGKPIRVEDYVEPVEKWFEVYAFPVDAPEERHVAVLFNDTTQRKKAEERQSFLLKLSDALRPLAGPLEIQAVSADLLGKHLHANQTHYGETIGEYVHIHHSYGDGLPPMTGKFRYQDFGDRMIAGYRAGQVQVCSDTKTDQTLSEAERAVLASAHIGAYVAVPLVKGGEWVATLAVHNIQPRDWRQNEIELVKEVAERTWDTVERARAEEALRKSEEKYRHQLEKEVEQRTKELQESKELLQTAFDTTVTGLAVFNAVRDENNKIVDFEFVFLNKAAIRYYGGNLKGKRYAELHPGIRQTGVFEHYMKAVEKDEPQDFELHYEIEGYDNWFRIVAVKLGDGVLMSYEDITARKQAEAERQKHLTLLHQSEALASIGSWEYDITTGKFTWSEGMYSLFQLTPEREVTPEIYLQLAVEEHKHLAEQVVKGIKGELAPLDETLHLKINNQERILKIKTTIIKDEQGKPVRALGVDMDVTATQKAQAQLKEQAHFIQSTNQALPDILFVMNINTKKLIYINHSFEEKLGFSDEQKKYLQQPFLDTIYEEDLPKVLVHIEGMRQAADGEVREIDYRRKDDQGNLHWFNDRNSVFRRDAEGRVLEKVGITRDITESKKAEQELKDSNISLVYANENLQQFASIASHDLQEPLRKLKLFVSVLKRFSQELPAEAKELMGKISVTSDRMSQLIREVLQYSKIAYGVKEFVPTSLDAILQNVFGDVDLLQKETGAIIEYPRPLPEIEAIPPQINQLFYNLVVNALKFRKDGVPPVIRIFFTPLSPSQSSNHPELKDDIAYIEIVFSDNGIGFDQEYAKQIFQIFERLHPTDEFEGTGVGLALCKKIVENHYGHIYAVSSEGEGASFYILLPVKQ